MKPAKRSKKWFATMAIAVCFVSISSAQTQSTSQADKKNAKSSPKAVPMKPNAAGSTGGTGDAGTASVEKSAAAGPRRDPFLPLVSERKEVGGIEHLPPGKAGLVISTVRVDGAVRSGDGMIAVLSNADQHVYFVREGDRLYDGDVEKIGLDGVTFRQNSKDAFGKPVERVVTKRIYASAGEQQ